MEMPGSSEAGISFISWSIVMRLTGEAWFALALFGIFSFGTYQSMVMNNPSGGPSDVGAAFFPFWVCVFIQILTAIIFMQTVIAGSKPDASGISMKKRLLLFVSILLLLFLYIFFMDSVGFIFSSIPFLVLVQQLLVFFETGRPSSPRGIAFSVILFSVVSSVLYFLFNTVFRLALP